MKYISAFLLLSMTLFNYHYRLNFIIYFVLSLFFILIIFYNCKKSNSTITVYFEMLTLVWPISWVNIFGAPTSELQLPWFYVIGIIICIDALKNIKYILSRKSNILILTVYISFFLYSWIPLIISKSIIEGLKEYIMIVFFVIVLFFAYLQRDKISYYERDNIINDIIFINFISALFIILQFIVFRYFGLRLFKLTNSLSFGGVQTTCSLLLEDTSCSTVMLGCGAFYSILRSKQNLKMLIPALIIMIGTSLTSRRTSVISLIIVLGAYFFMSERKVYKKVMSVFAVCLFTMLMLYFLSLSRPVEQTSQFIDNNGRFVDYISGVSVFIKNPIIGIGYDNVYLASLMSNGIIPHNTVLRWLDMGGIVLFTQLIIILSSVFISAIKKNLFDDCWVFLYVMFASNLIPDILNARFFVIICSLMILSKTKKEKITNEKNSIISSWKQL